MSDFDDIEVHPDRSLRAQDGPLMPGAGGIINMPASKEEHYWPGFGVYRLRKA